MNYAPFDELRPKLEKQYENAVYSTENCWSEEQLRQAWETHKQQNSNEERLLARAFLTALILKHAPVGIEPFNPFPGKFQHYNLLAEDLKAGYALASYTNQYDAQGNLVKKYENTATGPISVVFNTGVKYE